MLTSDDGGALVRLIAGDLAGHQGPGVTHTPITYAHVSLSPGAQLSIPWNPAFNALAYALLGQGYTGPEERPLHDHELVVFGPGDTITVRAAEHQNGPSPTLEMLILGGLPIAGADRVVRAVRDEHSMPSTMLRPPSDGSGPTPRRWASIPTASVSAGRRPARSLHCW